MSMSTGLLRQMQRTDIEEPIEENWWKENSKINGSPFRKQLYIREVLIRNSEL